MLRRKGKSMGPGWKKAYGYMELPNADFFMGVNSVRTHCMTISLLATYPS
jgi:hypothetical protein